MCVPPGGTPEGILDVAEYIVCVELFFFLFVLVLLLYPTGARRENDSNGHRDGKERSLVREKGRSRDTLFRKRSRCKRGAQAGNFFKLIAQISHHFVVDERV